MAEVDVDGVARQRHGCHYSRRGEVVHADGGCGPMKEPWLVGYRRHRQPSCHRCAVVTFPAELNAQATAMRLQTGLHRQGEHAERPVKTVSCYYRQTAGQAPSYVPRKLP